MTAARLRGGRSQSSSNSSSKEGDYRWISPLSSSDESYSEEISSSSYSFELAVPSLHPVLHVTTTTNDNDVTKRSRYAHKNYKQLRALRLLAIGMFLGGSLNLALCFLVWIQQQLKHIVPLMLLKQMAESQFQPIHISVDSRPYCSDVSNYFDERNLQQSIKANHIFHTQGGNLKSIQHLLDNHIDTTLQKLGVSFIPKDVPKETTQQAAHYLKDYFQHHKDPRGGYGKPLPGTFDPPNHPLILGNRYVEVADPVNTRERWDASLGPLGPNCTHLLQLGESGRDGTKWYCQQALEPNYNDNNRHQEDDCHVISIGGNDHWDFELEIVEQMKGCQTHTFDCTLKDHQAKRKPNREDIHFYPYCMDSHTHYDPEDGRQYYTYFDLVRMAGLTSPPKLLKMDVEGFEYDVLSHMIQHSKEEDDDGSSSNWLPQQIQVELHWATRMRSLSWMLRTRTSAELAIFSSMMFTGGGYMPIHLHWDEHCHSCMEVLYFRTLC